MRIYLDICCLKRPWDDQTQPRIAAETAAVLAILGSEPPEELLRSPAHFLENSFNSDPRRAASVAQWLSASSVLGEAPTDLEHDFKRFRDAGIRQMDAYHLAWALHMRADVLLTCDDRFLAQAKRLLPAGRPRPEDPLTFVRESWK